VADHPARDAALVMANRNRAKNGRRKALRQRKAIEADLRSRLTREITLDGTIAQSLLLDIAVSAALEISILNQRLVQCYATQGELERLADARAQLLKTLTRLRIPKRQDAPAVESIEDITAEYAERGR
jgi:hypothetical protein